MSRQYNNFASRTPGRRRRRRGTSAGHSAAESCVGKLAFESEAEALRLILAIAERTGDFSLQAYRCRLCAAWHAGHVVGLTLNRMTSRDRRRWVEQQRLREREGRD